MVLSNEDVLRIKEALIISKHYTGDTKYVEVLDKMVQMEKEYEENKKRAMKF